MKFKDLKNLPYQDGDTLEKKINYSELYGVKPEETDFSGAIKRSLEEGPKHLSEKFLKEIIQKEK